MGITTWSGLPPERAGQMEIVEGEVLQAILLGALPVALVLFTLVLCQVAVLWNSARRRVEVARIVASHKLEDEIVQASIDSVATSPEVQPKAPVIAEEDEDGNKLADRDSSVSGGEEGGHGVETMPLSPAADEHRPISRTGAPCSLRRLYLRWMLLCVVFCTLLVVLVLLFGFLAFLSFNESVTKASRSTSCKILSKGQCPSSGVLMHAPLEAFFEQVRWSFDGSQRKAGATEASCPPQAVGWC